MTATLPHSGLRDWCNWLRRRRQLVRVTGRSMLPLLQPGDLLFVDTHAYTTTLPQSDELVVAIHPHRPTLKIIKRVTAIMPDGRYFLSSDNVLEGSDSRVFGPLPASSITGRVTSRVLKGKS